MIEQLLVKNGLYVTLYFNLSPNGKRDRTKVSGKKRIV